MSEAELLTGKDAVEQQVGGREPLPEWNPPAADEPKEYDRGDAGIVDAANDLSRSRSTQDDLVKIIDKRHDSDDRKYYDTVENAAHDLSEYHKGEQAIQAAENLNELAAEVDQFRATVGQPDIQQQTAPAEQPQPDADPQPEFGEHPPSGLSPKLQAALADPELRAAYEAPYQAAAQVQQAYNGAVQQVAEVALSSVLANFPELAGYNAQQLPTVLAHIQRSDPVKAQAIQNQLQQVERVYSAAQQAKAVEAHQNQQRFQQWSKAEDDRLLAKIPELATDTDMRVSKAAVKALNDVGYSNEELAAAWNGVPFSMRDHRAQLLIWKAAQYDLAKAGIGRPEPKPLPAVQRPGIAPSRGEVAAVDLGGLRSEFKKAAE